jgi:hypothetical protein
MKLPINVDMTPQLLHRIKLGGAAGVAVILAIGTVFGTHSPSGFPETINGCSIHGNESDSESDTGIANVLKNRFTVPGEEAMDEDANLHSLLNLRVKGEDALEDMADKFDDSKAGRIRGYVQEVVLGVADSANCNASDPRYRDTYLYITKGPGAGASGRILVSVTPRVRGLKAKHGIDWSTEALKKYRGRYVEVSGWLFFDEEHWDNSKDNPDREGEVDRATCWSLYPVTDLQEVGAAADASSHGKPKAEHGAKDAHAKSKSEHSAPASHAKPHAAKASKAHSTHGEPAKAKPKPQHTVKAPVKPKAKAKAHVRPTHRYKPRARIKQPRRKVVVRSRPKAPKQGIRVYR